MADATDHDNLVTLIESVNNFHREVRTTLQEIKDNFQARVNDHEVRIKDLEITRVDFRRKLSDSKWQWGFVVGLGFLILGILIFHLTGYHI